MNQECLPIWCQCGKQGYIFVDNIEQSHFVVCKECGSETVEVFCSECRAGSELIEIEEHPKSWVCAGCKTEHSLSEAFYQNPITLYLEDDLPDDIYESDHYIEIPHKNELDLGKALVLNFTSLHMQSEIEKVYSIFRKKGAYSRFKDLLESKGLLDEWYKFEEKRQKEALIEWCEENNIKTTS